MSALQEPEHRLVPLAEQCNAETEWGLGLMCYCTLQRGHEGDHVAEDETRPLEDNYRVVEVWSNEAGR